MTRLCAKPYEGPIVSSHLSVRVREDRDFLCAVRGQIAIVRAAVDGGKSVLEGPGLASFVCGDSQVCIRSVACICPLLPRMHAYTFVHLFSSCLTGGERSKYHSRSHHG